MTSKEKAKKLYEIADALEEWGKYNEKVTNAAEWGTPEAKQIIRKALTLLVDNLVLLNECKNKYGCHSPLTQCFVEIEQLASLPETKDLGDYRVWTRDFTERYLWGGEKRSLADECIRYANKVNSETEKVAGDGGDTNTTTSKPDGIIGGTWNICGIPINIKKLCTKLNSHPFWLTFCLLVIVLCATFPVWRPIVNRLGGNSSLTNKDVPVEISEIPVFDEDRRTQLRPRIKKRVDELYNEIDNEKLKPWVFINAGIPVRVTKHDGSVISYEGVRFEGAPRLFFWSDDFIPPIIENAIVKAFDQTTKECRANGIDPKPHVYETNLILADLIVRVYNRMAYIDSELSSKGTHKNAQHKDVKDEINKMNESLKRYYKAAVFLASVKLGTATY